MTGVISDRDRNGRRGRRRARPSRQTRRRQRPPKRSQPARRGRGNRIGNTFRALHNRDFRLFWSGQVVSNTGTWAQSIAQAWLVLRLTDSPLALGTVTMLQALPVLLLGLFGGVIADRFPKRRLLLITQIGMLTQAVLLGTLTLTGLIQLWEVYVLALSLGVMNALDNPTRQTLVAELVPTVDLPNAIALNSLSFNTSRLLGPALGGVTIAVLGVAGLLLPERRQLPRRGGEPAADPGPAGGRGGRSAARRDPLPDRRGAALRLQDAGRAVRGDPDGGDRLLRLQLPDDPAADRRVRPERRRRQLRPADLRDGARLGRLGAADGEPWEGDAPPDLRRRDRLHDAAVRRAARLDLGPS